MKIDIDNRGFSLGEIKAAEVKIRDLKDMDIRYDTRRKTTHEKNVKLLKTLIKRGEKAGEKKEEIDEEELAISSLDELEDLTEKTKQKMYDLGIESPADLLSEEDDDLIVFLGVEEEQVKAWKDQIQA